MEKTSEQAASFAATGLSETVLRVLDELRFVAPTPIQAQAIPVALTGRDVIGIAQTGTGKTMAFGLPAIQRLLSQPGKAVILVPTRELALQVEENLRKITRQLRQPLKTISLIGGESIYRQKTALRQHNPRIIVATPGRLNDLLGQRLVSVTDVHTLVLDEADRMLDMGFLPQINEIITYLPVERQTLLFSATMDEAIAKLARNYQRDAVVITITAPTRNKITETLHVVDRNGKFDLLREILQAKHDTVLVFTRTKHGARKLCEQLSRSGVRAAEIHSNRSLGQRRHALEGFKSGRYKILVATDIAARGIDVANIDMVVNYDLPDAAEDYVHRIGRTGRAGRDGISVSFATPDQGKLVQAIERLTKRRIERANPQQDVLAMPERQPRRNARPRNDRPHQDRSRRPERRPHGRRPQEKPGFQSHGRRISGDGAFQSYR